ncbi:MAG: hypothetical protein AABY87_07845, partial [bacterium]
YRYDFNAVKDIVPLVKQMLKEEKDLSVCEQVKKEFNILKEVYRDAPELLRTMRREELRVRIHPVTITQTEQYVSRVFRRAMIGIFAVGIALTTSILYIVHHSLTLLICGLALSSLIMMGLIFIPIHTTYGFHLWMDIGRKKKRNGTPVKDKGEHGK